MDITSDLIIGFIAGFGGAWFLNMQFVQANVNRGLCEFIKSYADRTFQDKIDGEYYTVIIKKGKK